MKKLYVVDVSSMYFRAYYAIRPLSTQSGLPTNALYGFMSMTVKLLKDIKPDYIAYCNDVKEPSFRKKKYKDYKSNRTEMPEDLVPQIPYIKKLTECMGIPQYEKVGFEADDVIGTLVSFGRKNNLEVVIVSGDKDFAQLVGSHVSMLDTMKNIEYDSKGVIGKWGVRPEQMLDYLALVGDSSDNVPGVYGIGPKGAQKLLTQYKDLDGVYKNIKKIKGSTQEKLLKDKKMAYLSKDLVTIRTDIDLKLKLEDLKIRRRDNEKLKHLLGELEFQSFERKLFEDRVISKNNKSKEKIKKTSQKIYIREDIVEVAELKKSIPRFAEVWVLSIDNGLSLGVNGKALSIKGELVDIGKALTERELFWKGYKLKEFYRRFHIKKPKTLWDQFLAAYVLRSGEIGSFLKVYETFLGKKLSEDFNASEYYIAHLDLEVYLKSGLEKDQTLSIAEEIEFPLIRTLARMEDRGFLVDKSILDSQNKSISADILRIEKKVYKETGETFNLTSPKQLSEVLFSKLKLPVIKKTKTGYSTSSDVLEKLDHPICKKIMEFRELSKLKSTYIEALPKLINSHTGRIHTHFNQAVTTTGRLSSTHPNLQNIPIRTDRGRAIRRAFIADKGKVLISADYNQIELRVLAHISKDKGMIEAFNQNLDIHSATASKIFNVSFKNVTAEQRRVAKVVNFGIAYGMSPFGLSERLRIPIGEASLVIKDYFTKFPGIQKYMHSMVEKAKSEGYVASLFGRRRYIEELKSKNANIRKFGERAAINAPIQGTASDIVKKAMIELDKIKELDMLVQVHDELVFESSVDTIKNTTAQIVDVMENIVELSIPLKVNVVTGEDWEAAHA